MRFGIYPGGRAGTLCSHPDNPAMIDALVTDLAGRGSFVIREYVHFFGVATPREVIASLGAEHELERLRMPDEWYVQSGRELDLAVSYIPQVADLPGWLTFLDSVIHRYGHLARYLQITLEPNFPVPLIDGSAPGVMKALTLGLPHARARLDRSGLCDTRVGFSVAEPPEWLNGDDEFWRSLAGLPFQDFAAHLDYVGFALYPDAFSAVAPRGADGDVASLTVRALHHLRKHSLPLAAIPRSVPLHVVENGSPSGAHHTEHRQSESLHDMLSAILGCREEMNIEQYELFSLRDADGSSSHPVGTLGIVTDSYRPKPAFATYRDIVSGFGEATRLDTAAPALR